MATFRLEIVTAEGEVFNDDVEMLIAPGRQGQLGILPDHAPLLTQLEPGLAEIRYKGLEVSMAVSGGFLEVLGNHVVILADTAERAEDIDIERAELAVQRAEERVADREAGMDLERALTQIARSRVRLAVARRRQRRAAGPAQSPGSAQSA